MERDVEQENKHRKHKLIVTNPDWLNLPEPIATNVILEHLDLVDYIRFSAVCKKWQSIQKEHRIRYSPYPPPSPVPFPWLRFSNHYLDESGRTFRFFQPNKQKSYNILIQVHGSGYGYGWLLQGLKLGLFHQSICIILNPITGVQIEIPMIKPIFHAAHISSHISSPLTDPDCTIVMLDYNKNVYLHRPNDNSGLIKTDYSINSLGMPLFCHNKSYYVARCKKLCIVDALLPDPVERIIEMDCSEICVDLGSEMFYLVDFLGELVMVVAVYDEFLGVYYGAIKEFHVYKADFSTNKWVRMESLGGHALFFSYESILLLPAVDVGCKKNTIYLVGGLKGSGVAWRAFDVSTKNWFDGPRMSLPSNDDHSDCNWSWFLPTLDYFYLCNK